MGEQSSVTGGKAVKAASRPTDAPGPLRARSLWVTWETQRRNGELARAFGADFAELDFSSLGSTRRYLRSAAATVRACIGGRYRVVFAQCPSLVLAVLAGVLSKIFRFTLVLDAHNAAFDYLRSPKYPVRAAARFAFRSARFVIVSNRALVDAVSRNGSEALVLPDKLPEVAAGGAPPFLARYLRPYVTLIASYAADEPIEEFIKAVTSVELPLTLFITGSRRRAGVLTRYESERLHFTDFLSAAEFDALLHHSDLLADLTTREDCLVCGAYEAVAAGVPALLSDTEALRGVFPKGTVFAENSSAGYRAAPERFFSEPERVREEMKLQRSEFERSWREQFQAVKSAVEAELGTGER